MNLFEAILFGQFGLLACSGQSSNVIDADASVGGRAALGGSTNVAGSTHSGGQVGLGGNSQCGACPGYACQAGIQFTVHAPGTGSADAVITSLSASATPSVDVQCTRSTCRFLCRTTNYSLADGSYAFTFSSPGYVASTVTIDVVNPTNCGCCGCCPFSTSKDVVLQPAGAAVTGCCTDSLQSDAFNCGTCGHACPSGIDCIAGKCAPSMQGCIYKSSGFSNCDTYCNSLGKSCAQAGCGTPGVTFGYQTTSCPQSGSTVTGYASSEPCSQAFTWNSSGTDSFSCCCTNN